MVLSRAILISSSLIIHRPACRPGSSFRPAPRPVAPPRSAYRCLGSFRPVVMSSCRPVRLPFFYRHPVKTCLIHGGGLAAKIGNGGGGGAFSMRRFPQLINARPVIRLSPSWASDRGRLRRGGIDGSSSLATLVSSGSSISPAPVSQAHHGTRGGVSSRHLSSKQRHHGIHPIMAGHPGFIISSPSSHPIPIMKRLASASRLIRLVPSSRTIHPGVSTRTGRATKQVSEHEKPGRVKRDEKPGSKTGRRRNGYNETTERTESKQ